jgi:hypothetical protein
MRKVRTTMQPDVEVEVSDAEYLDLDRQGLLTDSSDRKSTHRSTDKTKED